MDINKVRLLNILLTVVLIAFGKYVLLYYVAAMHLSLEFLNSRNLYLQHRYKLYNFIFWGYELVLTERLRKFRLGETAEWLLNNAEHIAFGMIVCLKVYIYLAILVWKNDNERWKRVLLVIILFNIIGLINEYFQNLTSHRPIFVLIEDSIKDIKMNLLGTSIFFLTALCRIWWLKKNTK